MLDFTDTEYDPIIEGLRKQQELARMQPDYGSNPNPNTSYALNFDQDGGPTEIGMASPAAAPSGKPGFLSRLKAGIPAMIRGGINAAATPNIAGGGPTDVFRALQASRDAQQNQDLAVYQIARQRGIDEQNAQLHQAQMREYQARAAHEQAQAAAVDFPQSKPLSPEQQYEKELFDNWRNAGTPEEKAAAQAQINAWKHGGQTAARKTEVEQSLFDAYQKETDPDKKDEAWQRLLSYRGHGEKDPAQKGPFPVSPNAALVDATGKVLYKNPSSDKDKTASPANFRIIASEKERNLAAAERNSRKRIAAGEDETSVLSDLEDEKQRIQNAYEEQIIAAGGSANHFEYPAGSTTAAHPSAKAAAKQQPTTTVAPKATSAAPKGKLTDKAIAAQYLQKAGGDPQKARQLAIADGWTL